jgi:hypothetical protein
MLTICRPKWDPLKTDAQHAQKFARNTRSGGGGVCMGRDELLQLLAESDAEFSGTKYYASMLGFRTALVAPMLLLLLAWGPPARAAAA